jgi:hypothetical protein
MCICLYNLISRPINFQYIIIISVILTLCYFIMPHATLIIMHPCLLNITCTLVATSVILGGLECRTEGSKLEFSILIIMETLGCNKLVVMGRQASKHCRFLGIRTIGEDKWVGLAFVAFMYDELVHHGWRDFSKKIKIKWSLTRLRVDSFQFNKYRTDLGSLPLLVDLKCHKINHLHVTLWFIAFSHELSHVDATNP